MAHGMNGARDFSKVHETVTAGTANANAPTVAAYAAHHNDAGRKGIDGNIAVNVSVAIANKFGSTNIAVAFFSHGAYKNDVALCLNIGFVKAADQLQQGTNTAGVVSDTRSVVRITFAANRHICALRKDRIHMRVNNQNRAVAAAFANSHHIADGVNGDIGQTVCFHAAGDLLGSFFFVEGRRWNFTNLHLLCHCLIRLFLGNIQSFLNLWKLF